MSVKTATGNILETGTVALTSGTADADFPLRHLWDRNIGRLFKNGAVEPVVLDITQTDESPANLLFIPAGHGLAGAVVTVLASGEGVFTGLADWSYTTSGTGTLSASQSASDVRSGTYAGETDITSSSTLCWVYLRSAFMRVDASDLYTLSGYVKMTSGVNSRVYHYAEFYDADKVIISTGTIIGQYFGTGTYTLKSGTVGPAGAGGTINFPAGTIYVRIVFGQWSGAGDAHVSTLHYDDYTFMGSDAVNLLINGGFEGAIVDQFTPADNSQIVRDLLETECNNWRIVIDDGAGGNPPAAPSMAELILAKWYVWEREPVRPIPDLDPLLNADRDETPGGDPLYKIKSSPRRRRDYVVKAASTAQAMNITAEYEAWGGYKPFLIKDHLDAVIFGELDGKLKLRQNLASLYDFEFPFLEVIPS